jgi:hypothetical protein
LPPPPSAKAATYSNDPSTVLSEPPSLTSLFEWTRPRTSVPDPDQSMVSAAVLEFAQIATASAMSTVAVAAVETPPSSSVRVSATEYEPGSA